MSRSGYTDDFDDYGRLMLYRATVERAIEGKRGQAMLREMVVALDAMPVRELHEDLFVATDGRVCAMGALALARGGEIDKLARVEETDPEFVGEIMGIAPVMAAEIAFENDENGGGLEPEDRWRHMRAWAESNIIDRKPTPTGTCSWCCKTFTLRRGVINRHKWLGARCPGAGQSAQTGGVS
jgi:hypothetical protein